jgi:hypothetical protein
LSQKEYVLSAQESSKLDNESQLSVRRSAMLFPVQALAVSILGHETDTETEFPSNYWDSGLSPSSGFLKIRKHNVS